MLFIILIHGINIVQKQLCKYFSILFLIQKKSPVINSKATKSVQVFPNVAKSAYTNSVQKIIYNK